MALVPPNGFRYFSRGIGSNHASPAFQYVQDSGIVWQDDTGFIYTGAWRPVLNTDLGSAVSLSVSGLNLTVGAVSITGNPDIHVSNAVLATSGFSTINNVSPVPMSGIVQVGNTVNVNVTNTAPLAFTGTVITITTGSQSFDSSSIVLAQSTGNQRLLVADQLLSGISGGLAGTLNTNSTILNSTLNVAVTGGSIQTIVTGAVSASFDTSSIILAQSTGNNLLGFISGREIINGATLSGISGRLAGTINVSALAGLSGSQLGSLDVAHSYLPVSGIGNFNVILVANPTVTVANNLAVTGGSIQTITTGSFSATVDNTTLIAAVVSGNNSIIISNQLLTGISGLLAGNLTDPAWITGQVTVVNAGPIWVTGISASGSFTTDNTTVVSAISSGNGYLLVADRLLSGISGLLVAPPTQNVTVTGGQIQTIVTGSVSATVPNPIGITGTENDTNIVYAGGLNSPFNFVSVGGRAVNPTGAGLPTGYNTGDNVIFNFCAQNGAVLVNQGNLQKDQDEATIWTASTGSLAVSYGVSGLVAPYFGTCLPSNPNRRAYFIQNLATGLLLVKLSTSIPTTGNLDFVLKGASAAWAGDGAMWSSESTTYTGPVSVTGFGGAPCVYKAWEI